MADISILSLILTLILVVSSNAIQQPNFNWFTTNMNRNNYYNTGTYYNGNMPHGNFGNVYGNTYGNWYGSSGNIYGNGYSNSFRNNYYNVYGGMQGQTASPFPNYHNSNSANRKDIECQSCRARQPECGSMKDLVSACEENDKTRTCPDNKCYGAYIKWNTGPCEIYMGCSAKDEGVTPFNDPEFVPNQSNGLPPIPVDAKNGFCNCGEKTPCHCFYA